MSNNNDTQRIWVDNTFLNNDQAPAPKKRSTAWIWILSSVLVLALAVGGVIAYQINKLPILDNVTVAGVDVGGMTKAEAIEAVNAAIGQKYSTQNMTVTVVETQVTIPAEYCGGAVDVEAAVNEARRYGNIALPSKRDLERQTAAAEGYAVDLTPYMALNEEAIRGLLQDAGDQYDSQLAQSTWEVKGTKPTEEELANGQVDLQLVIQVGTADYLFDYDAMYQAVVDGYNSCNFQVVAPCEITEPDPVDLEAIQNQHGKPSNEAYMDENYELHSEQNGYLFNLEAVAKQLEEADYGSRIEAKFEASIPTYTMENLMADLFKDTLSTTTAVNSSQGGRDVNLKLACESINGYIVNPGEVFDYNEVLGERTAERGYKGGAAYQGGKTIYVIGGGICQVSSTLYSSVVIADLEIVTRENHGFAVGYLPLGIDATVSWGGPEFRFRNNSEHPIMIEAYSDRGTVTVSIKGIDDKDYYVKFENEVLRSYGWTTVYETMKANNPEGHKDGDVLTTPYTGYETKTYRAKYDKKTDTLISRELEAHSFYNKRDKVVVKIEQETPPETQPSTDTPTTPAG